jgi:hypothetical protein
MIMQTELTPEQIAQMSEVIAEYMGWKKFNGKLCNIWYKVRESNRTVFTMKYHTSWDWIHEVWEKIKVELPITNNEIGLAAGSILYGNKIEAFEALYNAIVFINNLNQESNVSK